MTLTLRAPGPGDYGWIVHRHGKLYAAEYGWDATFEGLVAEICATFIEHYDEARERCWVAELDGKFAGSIFLVNDNERTAKLRLLLVEPWARGNGVGKALVSACLAFAREAGYERVHLWTQNNLHAARHLYEAAGFKLTKEWSNPQFGKELISQIWTLELNEKK